MTKEQAHRISPRRIRTVAEQLGMRMVVIQQYDKGIRQVKFCGIVSEDHPGYRYLGTPSRVATWLEKQPGVVL